MFILPDGVTVNAPDAFVVTDVFAPPSAAGVPESNALLIFGPALLMLATMKRMMQRADYPI